MAGWCMYAPLERGCFLAVCIAAGAAITQTGRGGRPNQQVRSLGTDAVKVKRGDCRER